MAAQAAVPSWKKVDTNASDGGLASCLEACRVFPQIKDLIQTEGLESLADFVRGFHARHWESEVPTFHDKVTDPDVKGKRVSIARLKDAWTTANEALKNLNAVPPPGSATSRLDPNDMERPLDDQDKTEMDKDFDTAYGIVVENHLFPCCSLQAQVWREFRRWDSTVLEIGKLKSMLMEKGSKSKESKELFPDVEVSYTKNPDYVAHNVVDYYWGLRTLAVAWAKAGNYMVDSKVTVGLRIKMMPLDSAINYADRALRVTLNTGLPSGEQLAWLERKDRTTRALMGGYIRQQWPAQEALSRALAESNTDWTVVKGREIVGVHESMLIADPGLEAQGTRSRGPSPDRRAKQLRDLPWMRNKDKPGKSGGGSGKGGKDGKGAKGGNGKGKDSVISKVGKLASVCRDRTKICGAYNARKGCSAKSDRDCPQRGWHICGYITDENGRICSSTNHGYSDHRQGK